MPSRELPQPEAQQSEAPDRQVDMSSPRRAIQSRSAIGTIPPVPLPEQVAPKPPIARVDSLIARVSRPNRSLITAVQKEILSKVCEILNNQRKAVWLASASLDWALHEIAKQGHEQVL